MQCQYSCLRSKYNVYTTYFLYRSEILQKQPFVIYFFSYTEWAFFPMSKSKILNIRIDPDLKKRAKKIASADGRSLSNWVTRLITREVEELEKKKPGRRAAA